MTEQAGTIGDDAAVKAHIERLIERASSQRLLELFTRPPADALSHLPNRHGVSVVALRTTSLRDDQLVQILTYRLAQYLMADQLDPRLVYVQQLEHEPLANVSPADIHVIAGDAATGELLCYITLEALPGDLGDTKIRDRDRPLFPVEEVFGWGVFNRARILPDLPVRRVREAGRFAKNHRHSCLGELVARAPVEVLLRLGRLLTGRLLEEVDVCIGDIEEGVAKKNHDFFHWPEIVVQGVVPCTADESFGFYNYQSRTRYPYAIASTDVSKPRLDSIERALEKPGKEGLLALLELKNEVSTRRSSLEPPEGLPELTTVAAPQQGVPMAARRERIHFGDWLRDTDLFRDLSVAEAAVLGTFFERCACSPGDTIVEQGESGEDLYLIEAGEAEVQVRDGGGRRTVVATLVPGQFFGEIALVTGGERTADVVATTPMTVLRLSRDAYARYLAHLIDVESKLTRTALTRTHETLRKTRSDEKK